MICLKQFEISIRVPCVQDMSKIDLYTYFDFQISQQAVTKKSMHSDLSSRPQNNQQATQTYPAIPQLVQKQAIQSIICQLP